MLNEVRPESPHASPPGEVVASACCNGPIAERTLHSLDYDDGTSVVTTYRATFCVTCARDIERREVEQRRGMEERLPIGETVILPTFLRELRARFSA